MRFSVVIPLHGGPDDIRACLESLQRCREQLHEVVVVDDASPDDAPCVVEEFGWVRLIRLPRNQGFSAACNAGYRATTGEVVIFLNSDTVVPCVALDRMRESFNAPDVAAVGPYTNSTIYVQKIEVPYRAVDDMFSFAEGFARTSMPEVEVDFLVGFCLAVRREILEEVGGAFDERFGRGTYEDNDLSYRLRRSGYRLLVAPGAFVHHSGSATFQRENLEMRELLDTNSRAFLAKWRDDISTGFTSHLSGFGQDRIVFNPERKPERILEQLREVAKQADISLCMIVRNEEETLADALRHASEFFTQAVVVDTGSTDQTKEIAREAGAEVYDFEWRDDFAAARNESLRHARGKWIFWMDADDTLSLPSAEALLDEAASAPDEVGAFIVPSQSVGPNGEPTTRVDHLKLVRNLPGIRFEGRIHEQISPSIEALKVGVVRSKAVVIHTGYGLAEVEQEKKLARDWRILSMELQERPNHPFVLFNAAMVSRFSRRYEDAVQFATRAISEAERLGHPPFPKAFVVWVEALQELGNDEEALSVAVRGLRAVIGDPELHFHAATLLSRKGRWAEALKHFMAVQEVPAEELTSVDATIFGHKRSHNIGLCYLRVGNYPEGRRWLIRAIEQAEGYDPSERLLCLAAIQAKDFEVARKILELIENREGMTETWGVLYMRIEEALRGVGQGERALRKIARSNPDATGLRLAICQNMIATGRAPEALRDLSVMADNGVPEAAFYLSVYEEKAGNLEASLEWMRLAKELNPGHPRTEAEIHRLQSLVK